MKTDIKRRIIILLMVFGLFSAGLMGLSQTHPSVLAQSGTGNVYTLPAGMLSGGHYQMVFSSLPVSTGNSNNVIYTLLGPSKATLRGNGCCCNYLPCLVK